MRATIVNAWKELFRTPENLRARLREYSAVFDDGGEQPREMAYFSYRKVHGNVCAVSGNLSGFFVFLCRDNSILYCRGTFFSAARRLRKPALEHDSSKRGIFCI